MGCANKRNRVFEKALGGRRNRRGVSAHRILSRGAASTVLSLTKLEPPFGIEGLLHFHGGRVEASRADSP